MPRLLLGKQSWACGLSLFLASAHGHAGIHDLAGTQPGELAFGGQFESADGCAVCHGGGLGGDRSYLPHDSWAGTMMANAARDPIFRAALAVANQDEPGIGTFCLRCHSPIAFVRGHATPPDGSAFDTIDAQGIGCDTCHRAIPSGPPSAPYFVANAQITYSNALHKRGPYADSTTPVHETMPDAALSTSHFCGQCHQVTHPGRMLRDASGAQTNLEFPLDTTYQEWQNSDFARPGGAECIDCHLERVSGELPVATPTTAPPRKNPRNHAFVGANLWGIRAVMATNVARANAYPEAFSLALEQTQRMLASAVHIDVLVAPNSAESNESIRVTVRIENRSGHKFPTGYAEGRRAWIALVLVSPHGEETFLRGGYDRMKGEIVDSLSTHVYRAQHGHWNGVTGEAAEDLARHDMILSDTRIPPKGFVASLGTYPTSEIDYGSSGAGFRHYDEASFDLTIPPEAAGDNLLSARVYYQPITRAYIEHLAQFNTTDSSGQDLLAVYNNLPDEPMLAARQDVPISIVSNAPSTGVSTGMGTNHPAAETPSARGCDCASTRELHPRFGAVVAWGLAVFALAQRQKKRLSRE